MAVGEIRGDFHLHSDASGDGGLSVAHIRSGLDARILDVIAVTDHDVIAPHTFALAEEYAGHVIVGEEVTTHYKGCKVEIIGLDMKEEVPKGLPTPEAARRIKGQGAALYIPHPFQPRRKGGSWGLLALLQASEETRPNVIEIYNSRSWSMAPTRLAEHYAALYGTAKAVGSDAHGPKGWGRTYSVLDAIPSDRDTLVAALRAEHNGGLRRTGLAGRIQPASNKVGKKLRVPRLQTASWK